jgi:S-DNA-T family DNA segregation ATPase FtsK/SpoIIIE
MKKTIRKLRKHPRFDELYGGLLLLLAVASAFSLLSYDGGDPNWFNDEPTVTSRANWFGWVGSQLSEALLQIAGLTAFLIPPVLAVLGWRRIREGAAIRSIPRAVGVVGLFLSMTTLLHLWFRDVDIRGGIFHPGGMLGAWLADLFTSLLGNLGARIVIAAAVASLLVALTRLSLVEVASAAGRFSIAGARVSGRGLKEAWAGFKDGRREAQSKADIKRPPIPEPVEDFQTEKPVGLKKPPLRPRRTEPATQKPLPLEPPAERKPGEYRLPSVDLLNTPKIHESDNEDELLLRAQKLTDKFAEFNVNGSVVQIHPGPVVTTFEFQPEAGIKYSKIVSMADDLCLGLKAESVRIDRMPAQSTIGIEVPNEKKEIIYPYDLLSSEQFRASRSKLTMALGKDINGDIATAELDKMPHLLIAGATGAGKSVMLNGMIVSLLYKSTPQECRMIMIDTKMIELGIYASIPHLLIPVVTDPKKASTALKWAVREMEIRYRKLASVGVRNLEQFNDLMEKEPDHTMENDCGDSIPLKKMPFIVVVIDEMADLMMVAGADVEESIMRLAQMARAVGIHLILATQRPSVDVITGTIKANFPSRIAFRVSQRVDSRTIIDQNGAHQLLGRGDMLFLASGASRLVRLHSGFFTEDEVHRIVEFLKTIADPEYDDSVLAEPEEARGPGGVPIETDPMFIEALRLILQEETCSITLIQRRLRLGYARAARLVDSMEQQGLVGKADGAKPREILIDQDYLDSMENSP